MKKFFSFVAAVLFAGSMMADWSVIQFTADAAKGTLNDSVFAVNGFSLKLTDTDNKLQIDANPASFGSVESRDDYSYRLKTGGKSSSKNNLTLTLPEAGTVRIAVRTGSNADVTRTVVAVQGEDTLSNRVAQEADTIVGATSPRIYYYHEFEAEAGVVNITYPVNGVNFYAFAFEATSATPADPTNCAEAAAAALSVSANNELYNDGAIYTIEGYVTSIQTAYSDQFHNVSFWIADTQDGGNVIQAFRAACENADAAPEVGDKVQVTGSLTKYNTTPEFAQGCTFVIVEKGQLPDPVNLGEKTIAEFLTLANTRDTCILTGTIANVVNTQYGNFDLVELGNAEVKVYVYGLLTAAGESKKCYEEENLAEGDTITVKAIYTTYNNAPQVKNAIFVEVKKAAVVDTIVIDIESEVQYTDYVAQAGWWQFMAENDEYEISISNVSTTQAAGIYTIADLDADYTYLLHLADTTEIHFVAGSLVLTEGEDGSRTIEGVVTGDDEKIYSIKLVFHIPTAKTTVNVEIPKWALVDASKYYDFAGYILAGETADKNIYLQITIRGNNPLGTFTYDDCYAGGTGIEVAGNHKGIYSMNFTVTAGGTAGAERAFVTADILCYNNTLYHVTTLVGEGINNVEAAVEAIKRIVNGQVVIEKAGKTYNVNGTVIR